MEEEKKKWTANTTNQNRDGWRRINKGVEIDGPPEYAFDDQDYEEEDVTTAIISPPEKLKRRSIQTNILETGFTEAKEIPKELQGILPVEVIEDIPLKVHPKKALPILAIDAGTTARPQQKNRLYYPIKENEKDIGGTEVYLSQDPNEQPKQLPQGIANEYRESNIHIKLCFTKQDWDKVHGLIKRERDTIKQFARRAIIKLADEMISREIYKNRLMKEKIEAEVMAELKEKIRQEIEVEKIIWTKKYEERDSDAVQLYPSLNEEMKKQIAEEEAERLELAERIKRKEQKEAMNKAREERARVRELKKAKENAANQIENEGDNIDTAPTEEDNFALDIHTEGVLPEEKGISQDEDASDAPTQEEMIT